MVLKTKINNVIYQREPILPKDAFIIISKLSFFTSQNDIENISKLRVESLVKCIAIEEDGKEIHLENPFLFDEHFKKYPANIVPAALWSLEGAEDIQSFLPNSAPDTEAQSK